MIWYTINNNLFVCYKGFLHFKILLYCFSYFCYPFFEYFLYGHLFSNAAQYWVIYQVSSIQYFIIVKIKNVDYNFFVYCYISSQDINSYWCDIFLFHVVESYNYSGVEPVVPKVGEPNYNYLKLQYQISMKALFISPPALE